MLNRNLHYLETQEGGLSSSDMEHLDQLRGSYASIKDGKRKELEFLEQLATVYQLSSTQQQWRERLKNQLSNQSASMASSPIAAKPAAISFISAKPAAAAKKAAFQKRMEHHFA
jgi:hypothetical protein